MLQEAETLAVTSVSFLVSIVGYPRTSDSTNEVHGFFYVCEGRRKLFITD